MKAPSWPHTAFVCPLLSLLCMFCNFAVRLFPRVLRLKLATRVRRSLTWSAAPFTVTTKLPLDVFPARSVAVQATLVFPIGNILPEDGLQITTGDGSSASDAVARKATAAPDGLVAFTAKLAGTLSTGATWSILIPFCVLELWLPAMS